MKKIMWKILSSLLLTASLSGCIYERNELAGKDDLKKIADRDMIFITGSTTVYPLMDKISAKFNADKRNPEIILKSSGSTEGINQLLKDSSDVAMSSARMSPELTAAFRKRNKHYVEYLLAGDALVFAVNINNPVKKLLSHQLEDIFNGKITNWKQLGGEDLAIKVISRDQKSGTYAFFMEDVLKHLTLSKTAFIAKNNDEVLKTISGDRAAVGYTNFSMLDYSVDPVSISFDNNSYIAPRQETVNNMTYKYYRGLYLYYTAEKYPKIKSLLSMIQTDSTNDLITKTGYITVNQKLITQ